MESFITKVEKDLEKELTKEQTSLEPVPSNYLRDSIKMTKKEVVKGGYIQCGLIARQFSKILLVDNPYKAILEDRKKHMTNYQLALMDEKWDQVQTNVERHIDSLKVFARSLMATVFCERDELARLLSIETDQGAQNAQNQPGKEAETAWKIENFLRNVRSQLEMESSSKSAHYNVIIDPNIQNLLSLSKKELILMSSRKYMYVASKLNAVIQWGSESYDEILLNAKTLISILNGASVMLKAIEYDERDDFVDNGVEKTDGDIEDEKNRKELTPQDVKIRADIEISCQDYKGHFPIDPVKSALNSGERCSTELFPIKINLIAAHHFAVTLQTLDRDGGILAVNDVLETIKKAIEGFKGKFAIKEEARIVTDIEDEKNRKKMTPHAVKIRADIEISCHDYKGHFPIDPVKAALNTGEKRSTDKFPIKINHIDASHFVVTTQTLDRDGGILAVNDVLETIKKAIEGFKGKFVIKEEARIVTDIEDEKKRGDDEDEEESEEDKDEEEDEDDDGLMAPKGLDQQVDAEEASRDNRKKTGEDEESDEDDD